MASAQQIRDGLYSISWSFREKSIDGQHTAVIENHDVFQHCKLSFKWMARASSYLDIVIQFHEAFNPVNMIKILVLASKNGVKQKMDYMVPINFSWRELPSVCNIAKWHSSWSKLTSECNDCHIQCTCACCGMQAVTGIEILIDLTPEENRVSIENGSKKVLGHLLNLWNTKLLSDITFNCQGKSIKAHTLIIASGSPVLAAMLQNDFKEKQERVVDIVDIKANIFENLLKYIYTGEVALETEVEDVADLLVAADKYAVEPLKEECALYLSKDLKVENAASYLVLAHLHNSTVLHESTLAFMSKNAKVVCARKDWMDIIKNYPELCFQATQRMVGK